MNKTLSESFEAFKKNFVALIIGALIAVVGSVFIITFAPLMFGIFYMAAKAAKGEKTEISDVFKGFDYFITSWLIIIICGILVTVGLIFLILPGLIMMVLLQYSIAIAITEKTGAIDSIKKSIDLAKANFMYSILFMIIISLLNSAGSTIAVGALLTMPFTALMAIVAVNKLNIA